MLVVESSSRVLKMDYLTLDFYFVFLEPIPYFLSGPYVFLTQKFLDLDLFLTKNYLIPYTLMDV